VKAWDGGYWDSRFKKADQGVVRFRLSPFHTRGSVFTVSASWADPLSSQPLIAMHYKGFHTGERVSKQESGQASAATACWTGTFENPKVLRVRT
jgi:hypothetical protein